MLRYNIQIYTADWPLSDSLIFILVHLVCQYSPQHPIFITYIGTSSLVPRPSPSLYITASIPHTQYWKWSALELGLSLEPSLVLRPEAFSSFQWGCYKRLMSKYSHCCVCTTDVDDSDMGCCWVRLVIDMSGWLSSICGYYATNSHKHHRSVNHNALFTRAVSISVSWC